MRARPALPLAGRIKKATARRQPTGRFQRFTDGARRAVYLATEEARLLRHSHVGTEHLLLGLVAEDEELAAKALESLGLSLAEVRHQVDRVRERVADLVNRREQAGEEAQRARRSTPAEPPDTLRDIRAENQQLRRELNRLRGVLRDHGIDPDGGTAQPA